MLSPYAQSLIFDFAFFHFGPLRKSAINFIL